MSIFSVQWKLLRTSIDLPWPSSTVPNEIFLRPRSHATYKYCKIPGFIIIVPFKTDIHWGNPSFCFTHLHFFTTEISIFDANIIYEPTHTQNPHFGWLNPHFSCFNPNFSWASLRPPAGWTDRKSTRLNASHVKRSRMPSSALKKKSSQGVRYTLGYLSQQSKNIQPNFPECFTSCQFG